MRSASMLTMKVLALCFLVVLQVGQCDSEMITGKACENIGSACPGIHTSPHIPTCRDPSIPVCYSRDFHTTSLEVCPTMNITVPEDIPQPACIYVPDPVQDVQISTSRSQADNLISLNVSWTPASRNAGPLLYAIEILSTAGDPPNAFFSGKHFAHEETHYKEITGLPGGNNYTIYVTSVTAAGHASIEYPLTITDTTPHATPDVMSPSDVTRSFNIRLCSSCLTDPSQGLLKAAAIVICDSRKALSCQFSYTTGDVATRDISVKKAKDIGKFATWADAKRNDFFSPFRVTPDDFHEYLMADRSSDFIYAVGGSLCKESDTQTYCNGPLLEDTNYRISVIICNDIGCSDEYARTFDYNTKSASDDDDDDKDGAIIGLSVALGIVVLLCVALVVYVLYSRRSAS